MTYTRQTWADSSGASGSWFRLPMTSWSYRTSRCRRSSSSPPSSVHRSAL